MNPNQTAPTGFSDPNSIANPSADQLTNMAKLGVSQTQTQPTIPTSTITGTQPLSIPNAPNNGAAPASKAIANVTALNTSQAALLSSTDSGVQNAENSYNQSKSDVSSLIGNYLGKGQDQLNMEQQAGIPQLQTQSNQLTQQYLSAQGTYNQQYNDIMNRVGGTAAQKAQEISSLQQQHGYDLTDIGIRQSIAQNDYTNAQTLVNHQIDIKYAPMKDAIDYGMQFLSQNKDILTQQEQNSFQASLAVQNQMYTQGQYYDHLQKDTQVQAIKDASANGAPPDVLNSMSDILSKGGSIGDVAAAGGAYLKSGSYTPIQTGVDSNTGLPIYSTYNQKTGQIQPINPNNTFGTTGSQDTTINGYQMGATTTLGAYASDTGTQVNNIKSTVAKIQSTVGAVTDPTTAQAAITAIAPKSPITGDMVMNSATKYGVDPSMIIGVMQAETQCGTDGSKGAKQCNWGNVGNTDALMASGKSVAMKPQDGVDAIAKNLAQRQVQPGQNDPAQPVSTANLTPSQKANMVIKSAPTLIQSSLNFLPTTGDVYIDSSKLTSDTQKYMANAYNAKTGIPVLTGTQVSDLQNVDTALSQLNTVETNFKELAPTDVAGKLTGSISNVNSVLFDTDFGSKIKAYKSSTLPAAIDALNQITGSKRLSGFTAGVSESSLPQVGVGFLHQGDTYKDGINKLNTLKADLNSALHSILPNSPGASLSSIEKPTTPDTYSVNGMNYKIGADGTYYPVTQ